MKRVLLAIKILLLRKIKLCPQSKKIMQFFQSIVTLSDLEVKHNFTFKSTPGIGSRYSVLPL